MIGGCDELWPAQRDARWGWCVGCRRRVHESVVKGKVACGAGCSPGTPVAVVFKGAGRVEFRRRGCRAFV